MLDLYIGLPNDHIHIHYMFTLGAWGGYTRKYHKDLEKIQYEFSPYEWLLISLGLPC